MGYHGVDVNGGVVFLAVPYAVVPPCVDLSLVADACPSPPFPHRACRSLTEPVRRIPHGRSATTFCMEARPREVDGDSLGDMLETAIAPRPVAWISTVGADGEPNLAPYAQVMPVSIEPPVVAFAALPGENGIKDTPKNADEAGCFVVNAVTEDGLSAVRETASSGGDEFKSAGVGMEEAETVEAPRVSNSPVHIECRTAEVQEVGPGPSSLVLGDVELFRFDDSVVTDGSPDPGEACGIGYVTNLQFVKPGIVDGRN